MTFFVARFLYILLSYGSLRKARGAFEAGRTGNWCLAGCAQNYLSLRASALEWRGNPPVREAMYRQLPNRVGVVAIFGGNRYLVPFNRGIATTSVRTGLAMTGYFEAKRQTPI